MTGTQHWLDGRGACCSRDGCFWDASTCPEHASRIHQPPRLEFTPGKKVRRDTPPQRQFVEEEGAEAQAQAPQDQDREPGTQTCEAGT